MVTLNNVLVEARLSETRVSPGLQGLVVKSVAVAAAPVPSVVQPLQLLPKNVVINTVVTLVIYATVQDNTWPEWVEMVDIEGWMSVGGIKKSLGPKQIERCLPWSIGSVHVRNLRTRGVLTKNVVIKNL